MTYHDHHIHPMGYATLVAGLDFMDAQTLDEVLALVSDRADAVEGPVIAQRLNDETLSENRLPTAADLDRAVADRPVLIHRYCGHIAVANTAALKLAGVEAGTPDPPGGSFDRQPDGTPTGVLRETAVAVVSSALAPMVPPPSDSEILRAFAGLRERGIGSITGIISVGEPLWCGVADELGALVRLAPKLPISMSVLVVTDSPAALATAKEAIETAEGPIGFLGWKSFADGSLGGHTAALHQPYTDRPDTRGIIRLDRSRHLNLAEAAIEMGASVAIHAIGDRAVDEALDFFANLIHRGAAPKRLRMEHASLTSDQTIERMAHLGVAASVQPAFLPSEATWLEKRLGPERIGTAYRFRSLIEAGIEVLGGSDAPVELPDPERGITAAVKRYGINPGEALDIAEAEALFRPPAE